LHKSANKIRHIYIETRDIFATGAVIYRKEVSYILNDIQFIINSSRPNKRTIKLKRLENCMGTMVQSSSENIAIGFKRPVQLFF
jgi:DNA-directed RNA polymerase